MGSVILNLGRFPEFSLVIGHPGLLLFRGGVSHFGGGGLVGLVAVLDLLHDMGPGAVSDLFKGISREGFVTGTAQVPAGQFFHASILRLQGVPVVAPRRRFFQQWEQMPLFHFDVFVDPANEVSSQFLDPPGRCRRGSLCKKLPKPLGFREDQFVLDFHHPDLPLIGLGDVLNEQREQFPLLQLVVGFEQPNEFTRKFPQLPLNSGTDGFPQTIDQRIHLIGQRVQLPMFLGDPFDYISHGWPLISRHYFTFSLIFQPVIRIPRPDKIPY
jgi:hypothetical protein